MFFFHLQLKLQVKPHGHIFNDWAKNIDYCSYIVHVPVCILCLNPKALPVEKRFEIDVLQRKIITVMIFNISLSISYIHET